VLVAQAARVTYEDDLFKSSQIIHHGLARNDVGTKRSEEDGAAGSIELVQQGAKR
jgi:hypothetical protein